MSHVFHKMIDVSVHRAVFYQVRDVITHLYKTFSERVRGLKVCEVNVVFQDGCVRGKRRGFHPALFIVSNTKGIDTSELSEDSGHPQNNLEFDLFF